MNKTIYYNGAIIRGWSSNGDDLEYVYIVDGGSCDFIYAMEEAWKTRHVIRVTVEFISNPIDLD